MLTFKLSCNLLITEFKYSLCHEGPRTSRSLRNHGKKIIKMSKEIEVLLIQSSLWSKMQDRSRYHDHQWLHPVTNSTIESRALIPCQLNCFTIIMAKWPSDRMINGLLAPLVQRTACNVHGYDIWYQKYFELPDMIIFNKHSKRNEQQPQTLWRFGKHISNWHKNQFGEWYYSAIL